MELVCSVCWKTVLCDKCSGNYYASDRDGFNKLEMFARDKKEGWDLWGNELENSIKIQ